MSIKYIHLTGNTATDFGIATNFVDTYKSLSLCNVHATDSVSINLYLYRTRISLDQSRSYVGQDGNWDALETTVAIYYILKNVTIPFGVTLVLGEEVLDYDNEKYELYIKLSASDSAVDITLK